MVGTLLRKVLDDYSKMPMNICRVYEKKKRPLYRKTIRVAASFYDYPQGL